MLNYVTLVGRLVENPKVDKETKIGSVKLAIPRDFKNENGEYDTDFIICNVCGSTAEMTAEYGIKGDFMGIKGRLQNNDETEYKNEIIADKVTFLTRHTKGDD